MPVSSYTIRRDGSGFGSAWMQIIGSSNLIQSLQAASLIDECNVWTFPVILGRGKRLFEVTAKPSALRLVDSRVSTTGVMSAYVLDGDIQTGSFAQIEPADRELDRRAEEQTYGRTG